MASQTTNYNLHKIDLTDAPPDITVLNPNFDTIDGELKSLDDGLKGATDKLNTLDAKAFYAKGYHETDMNKLTAVGCYLCVGADVTHKPPTNGLGTVNVFLGGTGSITQEWVDSDGLHRWFRHFNGREWGNWQQIATTSSTVANADTVDGKHASDFALSNHNHDNVYVGLGANVPMLSSKDLNTCTTGGRWFVVNCTNRPSSADHGLLEVYRYDGANFNPTGQGATPVTFQRFTHYSTGAIYSRTLRYTNTWTTWERVGVMNRTYQVETVSSHSTKTFTHAKGGVCKITFPLSGDSPAYIHLTVDGVVKLNKVSGANMLRTCHNSDVAPMPLEIPFNSKFTIEYWYTTSSRQSVTATYQYYLNN